MFPPIRWIINIIEIFGHIYIDINIREIFGNIGGDVFGSDAPRLMDGYL